MNYGNDASEQIVRMSLNGVEVLAKLTGSGAKHLAAYLYTVMSQQKRTKGHTRLETMIKNGKELKVFSIKNDDIKRFAIEAKRYGILYCLIKDRDKNGMSDIFVKAEDAPRINRIVDKFKFSTVETATIKSEVEKTRIEGSTKKDGIKETAELERPEKSKEDKVLDEIMSKPSVKKETETTNPTMASLEKSHRSEPSSKRISKTAEGINKSERPSVRKKINEIKVERSESSTKPEFNKGSKRNSNSTINRRIKSRKKGR